MHKTDVHKTDVHKTDVHKTDVHKTEETTYDDRPGRAAAATAQ